MRATRLPDYVRAHQRQWDRDSASYEDEHSATLARHGGMAWGLWRQPEAELHALGDVSALAGREVLELGCGAARWSIALARLGARCIGLDVSAGQLAHARRLMAEAGVDFPLVRASAEAVPLPGASCDLVFCDYGAMTYADPRRVVPEVGRLLRPGGRLVFLTETALRALCQHPTTGRVGRTLYADYFGLTRWSAACETQFVLGDGDWIRLFRAQGLVVDDLIELRAPVDAAARTTYCSHWTARWARRWPLEQIWRTHKA